MGKQRYWEHQKQEEDRMPLNSKVAIINLSTGEITTESIPEKMRRLYLGGRGLGGYLMTNHIEPGIDPLGPDNAVVISAGFISGTVAPASGRTHVGGLSPLTGGFGSANTGGYFAPELKFAGFEHLVIKGASKTPVYLWIHNGKIEIRDASYLWGKDTYETQQMIRRELEDEEIKILCIGLAGENLVKFANVRTGPKCAAGRTGNGAIMGSKKLKAIAARGTMDLKIASPMKAIDYAEKAKNQILSTKAMKAMSEDGTSYIWNITNTTGLLNYKNGQTNKFEDWPKLTIETFKEKYMTGMAGCFGCPVHCRHQFRIKTGKWAGTFGEGPEYNSQAASGACWVNDWEAVLMQAHLCDIYGIDTREFGTILGAAMECYQRGILDKEATGGLDLDWNNANEIVTIIPELVAKREGLGELLADGPIPMIEKIKQRYGKDASYYIQHVKGMSRLGTEERPTPAFALGVATATRGADHLRSRPAIDLFHLPEAFLKELYGGYVSGDFTSYDGKPWQVRWHEQLYAVVDSLGLCKFQTVFFSPHLPQYPEWCEYIRLITGMEFTPDELQTIGERVYTQERMFNYTHAGFTRKEDCLPERYFKEAVPYGLPIIKGKRLDRKKFSKMLDEYYVHHGWDNDGIPTPETLAKLELDKEPSHQL